jgi:hypothetical protein
MYFSLLWLLFGDMKKILWEFIFIGMIFVLYMAAGNQVMLNDMYTTNITIQSCHIQYKYHPNKNKFP